jgi:hypothetical protein
MSAGACGFNHFVPCTAAADMPHSVAPVDNHAADAFTAAVISTSRPR